MLEEQNNQVWPPKPILARGKVSEWFSKWYGAVGLGLFLVVLLLSALWPKAKPWSAVFLNNGQVYFGRLNGTKLTNVYYPVPNASSTQIDLIKLGNEVHKPTDEINFNPQAILFTETLSDDSEILKSINQPK